MYKKNILVTGATGFLGSSFIKACYKEYNIFAVIRPTSDVSKIKDLCTLVLIQNLEECFKNNKIDIVLHLATNFQKFSSPRDYQDLINDNISYGIKILEYMKLYNSKNIINISTFGQYGLGTEEYLPVNFYSATKQAFVDLLKYFSEKEFFSVINLICYDVYGPNDKRKKIFNILNDAINRKDSEFHMTKSEQIVHLLYIQDLIEGLKVSIDLTLQGNLFKTFCLSNEGLRLKDAVLLFLKLSKSDLKINFGGMEYPPEVIMKPYCGEKLPNWECKTSIEDGLRITYNL
jgi:nucleoside-diphosphate-sugar epimerase